MSAERRVGGAERNSAKRRAENLRGEPKTRAKPSKRAASPSRTSLRGLSALSFVITVTGD